MSHILTLLKKCIYTCSRPLRKLRGHMPPQVDIHEIYMENLSSSFQNCRLAVVSDVHLPDTFSSTAQILQAVNDANVQYIVLPGDITNRYGKYPADKLTQFLQALVDIAPVFAIVGNHEKKSKNYADICSVMTASGVTLLRDAWDHLQIGGEKLPIYGMCDNFDTPQQMYTPSLLLVHYPHKVPPLANTGFSLAIAGHAHGGQIRIGKQGMYAPGQGFFPRYTDGVYSIGKIQLLVSRGLGDSSLPLRIHNAPHLPIIVLKKK